MFSDGVLDLIKSGVIDGCMKTTEAGKVVSTFVIGSKVRPTVVPITPTVPDRPIVPTMKRTTAHTTPTDPLAGTAVGITKHTVIMRRLAPGCDRYLNVSTLCFLSHPGAISPMGANLPMGVRKYN